MYDKQGGGQIQGLLMYSVSDSMFKSVYVIDF